MRRRGSCQGGLGSDFRYSLKFVWNNILKRDWKVIELFSVVVRSSHITISGIRVRVASRRAMLQNANFRDA